MGRRGEEEETTICSIRNNLMENKSWKGKDRGYRGK
jgi:hypothetical protein